MEQLETRAMLTCYSFGAEYDVYPVLGTNEPDIIEVSDTHATVNGVRSEIDPCYDKVSIYGLHGDDQIRINTSRFESIHIDASRGNNTTHFTGKATNFNHYAWDGDDTVTIVNAEIDFARVNLGDAGNDRATVLASTFSTLTFGFVMNPSTFLVIGCQINNFICKTSGPHNSGSITLAMIDTDVSGIAVVEGGSGVDLIGFLDCTMTKLRLSTGLSSDIIIAVNHSGDVDRVYDSQDIVREMTT